MREFTSLNTGIKYFCAKNWLNVCPVCSNDLLWNSYELEAVNNNYNVGFDFKVEHCKYCDDYYIYII